MFIDGQSGMSNFSKTVSSARTCRTPGPACRWGCPRRASPLASDRAASAPRPARGCSPDTPQRAHAGGCNQRRGSRTNYAFACVPPTCTCMHRGSNNKRDRDSSRKKAKQSKPNQEARHAREDKTAPQQLATGCEGRHNAYDRWN